MSGRGRDAAPVVVREYRHSQDECLRALELLLKNAISNMAAERAPEPDGRDTRRSESMVAPDGGVLMGGGTSVGTVVRMRGGGHVETNLLSTDQRAQEDQ